MARAKHHSSDFGLFSSKFIVKVPRQRVRRRKKSEAQEENEDRFREASKYATTCMQIPEMKAMYEKGITRRKNNAHTVATTDFLNPPKIHYINVMDNGPGGSAITIKATDDFEVKSVTVTISGADGKVMEEGAAIRNRLKRQMWRYETKMVFEKSKGTEIKATAEDHAENQTEGVVIIE
jgi:hypothetical protein